MIVGKKLTRCCFPCMRGLWVLVTRGVTWDQIATVGIYGAKKVVEYAKAFIKARKEASEGTAEDASTVAVTKDAGGDEEDEDAEVGSRLSWTLFVSQRCCGGCVSPPSIGHFIDSCLLCWPFRVCWPFRGVLGCILKRRDSSSRLGAAVEVRAMSCWVLANRCWARRRILLKCVGSCVMTSYLIILRSMLPYSTQLIAGTAVPPTNSWC